MRPPTPNHVVKKGGDQMAKLIIGGAELRFVDTRYDDKSKQMYHRLNFKADLKKNLADDMGWDVLDADGKLRGGLTGSVSLEGEISIKSFWLKANGLQQILELKAEMIEKFSAKTSGEEIALHFQIVACGRLAGAIEEYQAAAGFAAGQLKCTCTEDEQLPLTGTEPKKSKVADIDER